MKGVAASCLVLGVEANSGGLPAGLGLKMGMPLPSAPSANGPLGLSGGGQGVQMPPGMGGPQQGGIPGMGSLPGMQMGGAKIGISAPIDPTTGITI